MAGGMATTHLSRTGKNALSLKARHTSQLPLDLEAAVLSSYGYHGQTRARPRSTNQMQSRLKHLLSRGKDQYAQRDLLHGYMFDAWSGRKCSDQFLDLNAKWPLNTDAYLKLLTGLDLGDQLLTTLLTATHQESTRLVGLILESSEVTAELFGSLFIWTVDQIDARYRKKQAPSLSQEASSNPGELICMWTDRRGGISYWGLGDRDQTDATQSGVADEIIQGLLASLITILVEHPDQDDACQFEQDILRRDAELVAKRSQSNSTSQKSRTQKSPNSNHQEAFMTICDNLRRNQDFPGYPPSPMTRLAAYKLQGHYHEQSQGLQEHVDWIESSIHNRSVGWLSCAKLKLQFFAVFGESYINEELADIICEHDLHWDLCSTLLRYLGRYRADPIRMPADTFQLGCELLLSVFTKRVGLRLSLRDHLFHQSNAIYKDVKGPLFGSWELWRMNIDTLLTSILNQVVVSEDSPQSSTVSPHTIEALIKPTADINDPGLTWGEQQQDNFADFVVNAMTKRSNTTGMLLLDPTAFLTDCVAPFLDEMESGQPSPLFQSVTRILLAIYEREPAQAPAAGVSASERLLPHGIQRRILLRLLQLRTRENPWTAEGRDSCKKAMVERGGGEHLDGLSRLCETIVARMNAHVSSLAKYDQEERELFLEFGKAVQGKSSSGESVDLESRLIIVPLIDACRRNLALDMGLPSLPSGLFGLCGDRLRVFEYSRSVSQHLGLLSLDKAAEAVILFLDLGRMCDDVLADLIQAIDFGSEVPAPTQLTFKSTMIPALYRVLSISTRHQSHRLLIHAVPVMSQLWGRPGNRRLYWDDLDNVTVNDSQLLALGSYWDSFKNDGRQQQEEDFEMTESTTTLTKRNEDSLDILLTLEMVLRCSLEPLPSKGVEPVIQVYRCGLGYDMMPDQVASLVQSVFKAIRIEWTKVHLDHLLYCFMKVCEMSNIVNTQHQTTTFPNRLTPQSELESPLPSSIDEVANWRSVYSGFMSQPMPSDTRRQLEVARAKARDELVLMAMNLSEVLVSHQDSFYGKLPELPVVQQDGDSNGEYSKGRGRGGRGGRGRGGRGSREQKGSVAAATSGELAGGSGSQGRNNNRQEARQAASGGPLDKGTQAWFNGIMTTPSGVQESSSTAQDNGDSIDTCAPDPTTTEGEKKNKGETPKEMLNVDQVDCLSLALAYLPVQESQAVRSRLHRLFNLQTA
ncbi:hypothetical protein BGZ96_007766 [Linnemannia gamsii]|uniref:Mediator of RNA polymerase II transcription subunit 12 n=1 Tax=Linnemannia gamsii TaxID=64522 RepID=A0ABQ7KEL2_9FUNG|nr:hypothetical protein BGZ96_007766 [Linnemannia gamsii]